MNVLMMSLLYPEDERAEVERRVRDKMQYQINNYQRAFEQGIRDDLQPSESLLLLNSLPVGIFPLQYRWLWLHGGVHDGGAIRQLGCLNLPWFKQKMRMYGAKRQLTRWVKADENNRTVLLYTQYLPYVQAVTAVRRRFPELKACVIVTDLPKEWGLSSGRTGLLKRIEDRMADKSLALLKNMDGFVLLTDPMAEALGIGDKPYVVIEGLIQEKSISYTDGAKTEAGERPVVLYTGTLEPGLGIQEMLDAFAAMPETELLICGQGSMSDDVRRAADAHENIQYLGFVPQQEALACQARASALINPRQPNGLFTKYSFPSKTLEYLRSGKPVLSCRLEGIPADYDGVLRYMEKGSEGIREAVSALFALSAQEREAIGQRGRAYVLSMKNPRIQCEKLLQLLRSL